MNELAQYVRDNTSTVPAGTGNNAVNVVFFDVEVSEKANRDTLRDLVNKHQGVHNDVAMFDSNEHSYIELGGWVGDQGIALALIGMGAHFELWKLLSPYSVLGDAVTPEQALQMAGMGLMSMQAINA